MDAKVVEIKKTVRIELDEEAEDFYQLFKSLYKTGFVISVTIGEKSRRVTIHTNRDRYVYEGSYANRLIDKINSYEAGYHLFSESAMKRIKRNMQRNISELIREIREKEANSSTSNRNNLSAHANLKRLLAEYEKLKQCELKK